MSVSDVAVAVYAGSSVIASIAGHENERVSVVPFATKTPLVEVVTFGASLCEFTTSHLPCARRSVRF